ncbi:class I SAM-dependent methyltransferase [Persicirhabdus sediminis]|uniref:Methyltransferase domain-containing protein n=1 Tax=Persicirhabdus sediminis TaxID=454144 RepID=A0A8J7MA53_9BACT|nr:methyltransferase domain-containing protein [Persicirhabdus sediminis]MBK1789744.1 methyltransferase domain-containing protein [Persicirhabdus sediminis]
MDDHRTKAQSLAHQSLAEGSLTGWFDKVYQSADGNSDEVPWAKMGIHPILQPWLDKQSPAQDLSAVIIGCGLGDDAEAIAQLGYNCTAFDISDNAINWCKERFPQTKVNYLTADLFELPSSIQPRYDFVLEIYTIQSLPLSERARTIQAIAELVAPAGELLLITMLRPDENQPAGPPWPLSQAEIGLFEQCGLELKSYHPIPPNNADEAEQARVHFTRPS